MHLPAKKKPNTLLGSAIFEPAMSPEDWRAYLEGWRLFNERDFWHAHEAWERVWMRTTDDSRVFFQGIIQLTAAFHLLCISKRYGGGMRNLEKAEEKLRLFSGNFLGVEITGLQAAIDAAREELHRLGKANLSQFNLDVIPRITPRRS